jgi:glycosyltransferase involved in cell wall biosynthesis
MAVHRLTKPPCLVSVIVPSYDAEVFIHDCLTSIFAQTGPFELDVIVVNDGSSGDTLQRVCSTFPLRFVEQPHRGPAAARNTAMRMAHGEFVAFLDSDDLWPAGKLARQVALLQAHPDVGLVFGDCRQFNDGGPFAQTLFENRWDSKLWGDPLYVTNPYAKLLDGNFITTGSVVMRRDCMDIVGFFDESLRLVEDLDYWLRISLRFPLAHLDEVCLLRRRHLKNASHDQVAMTLAYLRVLDEHVRRYGVIAKNQGANPRRLRQNAYQELGHLYMGDAAFRDAAVAYMRSLNGPPSVRGLYYLLTALVGGIGFAGTKLR